MHKEIESFIEEQKNLSFCTSVNDEPHCASCFYAYIKEDCFLVFKSEKKTKHISNALSNNNVAGTIIPDINKIGIIKGIQFTGKFKTPDNNLLNKAQKIYYNKYPFAIAIPGELWGIHLIEIKMTNNTLGFGKKLTWKKLMNKEQ